MFKLVPASIEDEVWLERLRRDVYQELFMATFGGWDEARHRRHCVECWERGAIYAIEVDGVRVGMIQLFDQPDAVEVGEIQIQPSHQNQGLAVAFCRIRLLESTSSGRRCYFLSL